MPDPINARFVRVAALAFLVSAAACEPSDNARAPAQALVTGTQVKADSAALGAVRARYPGIQLGDRRGEAVPGTGYRAASIPYEAPGREAGYGEIVAAWTADTGRLVWTYDHRGDFRPHRLVWMDADRDGRTDLFFTSGEENVLQTHLFINRTGRDAPADSAFTRAYYNGEVYATVLDLDGDGAPELLEPPPSRDEFGEPGPCDAPPRIVSDAAAAEYARRAGPFDRANVKYYETGFEPWTLHLLEPVRILQVREGQVRDATAEFPEHLRWRIGVLEQWRAAETGECRAEIESVVQHLRDVTSE